MKISITTALLAFAFIIMARGKIVRNEINPVTDADSSFIFIYRGGQFMGSLTNFTIWVDDHKLCKISNGKYFKVPVKPGTHIVSAKRGGVGVMKKETEVEVDVENGKSAYISCSMKSSITRVRLVMEEVVAKTGVKGITDMKVDNCQGNIEDQ
ncbi:MAG: DUF2846 domain-containing protein [Ginsengibacter sp.]